MSRRVVLLAYYFPPLVGIASERAASISRHLKTLGWEPTVVTPESGFYHRAVEYHEVDVDVVRTRSLELSRVLRGMYTPERSANSAQAGAVQALKTGRLGNHARRFIRDFMYVPDAQFGWIPFAVSATVRTIARGLTPAVIYSTSVPYSAHLAAMAAARRPPGTPWVAEFRDPWACSERKLRRRVDVALQRAILRNADHVVVTAPALAKEFLATYDHLSPEKVSVITNGFEPMAEQPVPLPQEPMTVLYAGTVATGEDMTPVLTEFDRLGERRPGALRLRVLGPPDPWQKPEAPAGGRSWLALDGVVSPAQAREAMRQSSVLLHVQRHPAYRDVLPGKLFEYIGARRPIIAVCPTQSDMGSLLREHADVRFVAPDRLDGLVGVLEQLIDQHAHGLIQGPRVPESLTAPLRRHEQAKRLAAIFVDVIEGTSDRPPPELPPIRAASDRF